MLVAFGFLILSILLLWLPACQLGRRLSVFPSLVAAVPSSIFALLNEYVTIVGLAELVVLGIACYIFRVSKLAALRWSSGVVLTILALALAMHRLPGFDNPVVWSGVYFSAAAAPMTQYLNYDKGMAGLLLLALVAPRCRSVDKWRDAFGRNWVPAIVTIAVVMGAATAIGFVRFDPKWSQYAIPFFVINLFFVCVAEEAFFRGFLQERLHVALGQSQVGMVVAILVSGGLFGVAHLGGGVVYAALASLAGVGYATVYARSRKIEPAILAHFGLNAVHFLFFTYPFLQKV